MKVLRKPNKEKMVRIIIGNSQTGSKNISAPTKTITLLETSVEETYKKLIKFLESQENE